jgi:hypothetical protein
MDLSDNPTGCCPRFHSEPWNDRDFSLEGLKFIRATTVSLFHIPLNMGQVMTRTQAAIDAAGSRPTDRYLILSRDLGPWKAEHYFLVSGDVPGFQTLTLPGEFHARVFEGPYSQMASWYKAMASDDIFAFYTTCPNCAKAYGKNYVVLLARNAAA